MEEEENGGMDDYIGPDDVRAIEELQVVRKHIMSYFDPEALMEEMKRYVKESPCVEFASARAEKFLNVKNPVFNLKIVECEQLSNTYGEVPKLDKVRAGEEEKDSAARWMLYVLHGEVASPLMDFLIDAIDGNYDLRERIKKALPEGIPEGIMQKFFLSTMFSMRADVFGLTAEFEYVR
jgi:hypothetical protein